MSDHPKLTIGMACYDDFDGVWFTINALRLYHAECMPDVEFIVVDNNPHSSDGQCVRRFLEGWVPNARYVEYHGAVGTAAPRNEVFRQAAGDVVLCLDPHVLLEPDTVRRLIQFYDTNPDCLDLIQGPLVYDDLKSYSSHFNDEWREQMWGTWGTDPRGSFQSHREYHTDPVTGELTIKVSTVDESPFDIPAQGLGLFSCRRHAWLGFHPGFYGFGGEEFYIHEKFRQAGRRTLCLPFLRWIHRFNRPRGVPYPLMTEHKFRNYVLGLRELQLPVQWAAEHFAKHLSKQSLEKILKDPDRLPDLPQLPDRPHQSQRSRVAPRSWQLWTWPRRLRGQVSLAWRRCLLRCSHALQNVRRR